MPRRAAPLDPEAGPLEGFAAKLRDLRDRAGTPSIQEISDTSGLPRSSVYAVLAGKRVPNEETLTSFVRACGGDSAEWLARRSLLLEKLAVHSEKPKEASLHALSPCRTVLVAVRDQETVDSTLAAIAPIETDHNIQVLFTVDQQSSPKPRTHERLSELGALVIPWRQATAVQFDLILAAHASGSLKDLRGPLLVLATEDENQPTSVAPDAVVAGDLQYEQIRASVGLRSLYRRALGVQPHQQLVQLSSTWGSNSLLAERPDLPLHLLAELPTDRYKIALTLHPNIWHAHGRRQVETWLQGAVESGLLLIHPKDWKPTLIASDVLIGDHGSVTGYASALGIPTISADDKSPAELANAVSDLPEPAFHQPAPKERGHTARQLRTKMYELLGLSEPSNHVDVRALEIPAHTLVQQPTSFRMFQHAEPDEGIRLVRFPLVPGFPRDHSFIVATDQERNLTVTSNASVVVATSTTSHIEAEAITEELRMIYPGARLVAAPAESWLFIRSHRRSCEIKATAAVVDASKGFIPDPALVAAAAYQCLLQSHPQGSHDARVRYGVHEFTVQLNFIKPQPHQ